MFVHTQPDGSRWIIPILFLSTGEKMFMSDDMCKSFPWKIMRNEIFRGDTSGNILLSSGFPCCSHLSEIDAWRNKYNVKFPDGRIRISLELEPTASTP